MILTPGGAALHHHAIQIIVRLQQLALCVEDFRTGAGRLRLWVNPSALGGFLPPLLAEYARGHVNVKIDLEEALSEDSVRALRQGVAELAVIGDNVPREGLETLTCNIDHLVLVVPERHQLAKYKFVPIARALEHDLVTLPRNASLTRQVITAAEAIGIATDLRVQVRSFDSMCRMVAGGFGLAILPWAAAILYAKALHLCIVKLHGIEIKRRLLLAMRRRVELPTAAAEFVTLIERRSPDLLKSTLPEYYARKSHSEHT